MKIAVSYLKTPFSKEETIQKIDATSADYIHVDIMDGILVKEKNLSWEEISSLLKNCQKELDIHLMTLNLEENIEKAIHLKPKRISFHIEATMNIRYLIKKIKSQKIEVGLAINPNTAIENLLPYLKEIDTVLVMSVNPGMGGQKFIPSTIEKLQKLQEYQKDYPFQIEVDGGINNETISLVSDYANIIVSGSYICNSDDFETQISILKNQIK